MSKEFTAVVTTNEVGSHPTRREVAHPHVYFLHLIAESAEHAAAAAELEFRKRWVGAENAKVARENWSGLDRAPKPTITQIMDGHVENPAGGETHIGQHTLPIEDDKHVTTLNDPAAEASGDIKTVQDLARNPHTLVEPTDADKAKVPGYVDPSVSAGTPSSGPTGAQSGGAGGHEGAAGTETGVKETTPADQTPPSDPAPDTAPEGQEFEADYKTAVEGGYSGTYAEWVAINHPASEEDDVEAAAREDAEHGGFAKMDAAAQ